MVLVDELERIGYRGALPCVGWPFHAYYELHIEQGPLLERSGRAIGVPKGIVCLHVYNVFVDGEANQVGPTPMEGRRDALVAAAEMILKVRELPAKMGGDMVATVGKLQNHPNSSNTVPDRVHFTVDIRAWDDDLALRSWDDVKADFESIAAKHGCPIRIEEPWRVPHTEFDPHLVRRVRVDCRGPWLLDSAYGERCRSRHDLRLHGRSLGHDLRTQRRRPESRGSREHQLGGLRGGSERASELRREVGRRGCGVRPRGDLRGASPRSVAARRFMGIDTALC